MMVATIAERTRFGSSMAGWRTMRGLFAISAMPRGSEIRRSFANLANCYEPITSQTFFLIFVRAVPLVTSRPGTRGKWKGSWMSCLEFV